MSYSTDLKEHLCEIKEKSNCCHNAFLYGVYASSMKDGKMLLATENIADGIIARLKEIHDISSKKEKKTKKCAVVPENVKKLEAEYGEPCSGLKMSVAKCENCLNAFVRGIFVGCGTMNDPTGDNHLELVIDGVLADELLELLSDEAIFLKKSERKGKTFLYCKSGDVIQDMLTYLGDMKYSLEMIQSRVTKEQLQYASRYRNFEFANLSKATMSGQSQVDAINLLEKKGVLRRLSPELIETARLRLENPGATLDELRQISGAAISKSGLNHRLKRLVEEAEALKTKEVKISE